MRILKENSKNEYLLKLKVHKLALSDGQLGEVR